MSIRQLDHIILATSDIAAAAQAWLANSAERPSTDSRPLATLSSM
jgi:hypothetical protein